MSYAKDSSGCSNECIPRQKAIVLIADVIREKQAEIVRAEAESDEWERAARAGAETIAALESDIESARERREDMERRRNGWRTATFVGILIAASAGIVTGLLIE